MLKIIEQKDHCFHTLRIESLLDLFRIYHNFELSSEEKGRTTFIIAEDERNGVYGGALLYKKKVGDLYDKIKNIVSTFHPNGRKVWVATLCFSLNQNVSLSTFDELDLCEAFYQSLLKKFIKFGRKKKAKFFILSLSPLAYVKEKVYGDWPYLLEIHHKEATDGLFHGILGLSSNKRKICRPSEICLSQLRRYDQ
ncbi:MAG: hypothetical protein K2W92_00320 [Alphaproteobacteria bacterium]|nr:hypothetical protein [Alphaproteobacteria bacterium]